MAKNETVSLPSLPDDRVYVSLPERIVYRAAGQDFSYYPKEFPQSSNDGVFAQGYARIMGVRKTSGRKEDESALEAVTACHTDLSTGNYSFGGGGPRRDAYTVHLHSLIESAILNMGSGLKVTDVSKVVRKDAEQALLVQCEESGVDFVTQWDAIQAMATRRVEEDKALGIDAADVEDVDVAA